MIWASFIGLSIVVCLPAMWILLTTAWRASSSDVERNDTRTKALAFYKAQLSEIDDDRALSLLNQEQYEGAKLEIQRRMIKYAEFLPHSVTSRHRASQWPGWFLVASIPLISLGLYLVNGNPSLPAFPLEKRVALEKQTIKDNPNNTQLIEILRQKLQTLSPTGPEAFEGFVLLGQAEMKQNHLEAAIDAWQKALKAHFDPLLGAITAEAMSRQAGHVTPEAAELFRSALEKAPKDAPWRVQAEQRISESLHH